MKKALLSFMLLIAATTLNAQTIVKGDMNDDNEITVADVMSEVNVVLGKFPKQTISLGGDPYFVDNTLVVGTWYAPDGTSFALNEDGTTTFPGAATYKFRPNLGTLLFFNASGKPVKKIEVDEVEKGNYLLTVNSFTNVYTYYTNSSSIATGITLDQTSLEIVTGATAQLTATVSPETAFADITWTSSDENIATVDDNGIVTAVALGSCIITATENTSKQTATCAVSVKQGVTSITLSKTTIILNADSEDRIEVTATVLPKNASNKDLIWNCSDEEVAFVTPFTNSCIISAQEKSGIVTVTCEAADGSGVKATCIVHVIDPDTYVDLGLPSGTLWATCNVGADSPEEFGNYFAWGETTGGKTNFNWTTYNWCEGNGYTFTKYCTDSSKGYNGFTDGKQELDLEDDAAYVNCGPGWRMPSNAQFEELINSNNTTTVWTDQDGVSGYKITSKKNNKSIFLPAAGGYDGKVFYSTTHFYWSRTLVEGNPANARGLDFDSDGIDSEQNYSTRDGGCSVRPVRLTE